MNELRRGWGLLTFSLLLGGAALCIHAAFIGAERSAALFNSLPMVALWLVLVMVLFAGVIWFRPLRHCPGLLGLHLGPLLILLGFMASSDRGHRLLNPDKVRWSYLPLQVGQESRSTLDRSLRRTVHELPFAVRLDAFEIDRYPPAEEPPELHVGARAYQPATRRFEWSSWPVEWTPGLPAELPGTSLRMTVHSISSLMEDVLRADLELHWGDERKRLQLVCAPDEPFARIELADCFPGVTALPPEASLFLIRPEQPVRQYRSRLAWRDGSRERTSVAWVNRPVRIGGYDFYQYAWGEQPALHTILLVVSHSGMRIVHAGFLLLGFGVVWRFWIRPLRLIRRRRGSPCT